jgi:hypothetical protein
VLVGLCVCSADRYNMDTGEWIEYTPMSNDKFKEQYGCVMPWVGYCMGLIWTRR